MARMNPIGDAMSTIKNAADAGKEVCILEPASKLLGSMLAIMKEKGYVGDFEFIDDRRGGQFRVTLSGQINKCGSITPRYSLKLSDMEFWETQYLPGKDFGILLISTSKGVLSHDNARKEGIGGELLGYVY